MIHTLQKQFQLVLWENEDRSGEALRLDFDTVDEARAAFEAQHLAGTYRAGILMEWHKVSGASALLDIYP